MLSFEFVSCYKHVGRLAFEVRRRTIVLYVYDNLASVSHRSFHRVEYFTKQPSDLERVMYAIDAVLSNVNLARLGRAVGSYRAVGLIFEKYLRETQGRASFTDCHLTLRCAWFKCVVDEWSGWLLPRGYYDVRYVDVPSPFFPFFLAGQGVDLVAATRTSIVSVQEACSFVEPVSLGVVGEWSGFRFFVNLGDAKCHVLARAAPAVIKGLSQVFGGKDGNNSSH